MNISIHALREEGDPEEGSRSHMAEYFYPRPPRGGRQEGMMEENFYKTISIHALREEGDWSSWKAPSSGSYFYPRPPRGGRPFRFLQEKAESYFYPRPPRGGRPASAGYHAGGNGISIHALREEGDSKNGEKHLHFCFIIKRSAQIWKSLSKNIRKKSRDLHRTA